MMSGSTENWNKRNRKWDFVKTYSYRSVLCRCLLVPVSVNQVSFMSSIKACFYKYIASDLCPLGTLFSVSTGRMLRALEIDK